MSTWIKEFSACSPTGVGNYRKNYPMTSRELLELLDSIPETQFSPYHYYSKDSDSLMCRFRSDADYSERLSDHVKLFRAIDGGEIVGCRIKGMKGILEDLPNFIHVQHQDIELTAIFWSFRGGLNEEAREVLKRLAEQAAGMKLQPV